MRAIWDAAVVGLFAAGACYHANPQTGAPCDPGSPVCPEGQTCALRAGSYTCDLDHAANDIPDAGGTSDDGDASVSNSDADAGDSDATVTPSDHDGDGVPDIGDNCPDTPNHDQANEDGDSFGDACDNCPPYPSNGTDSDGDGVGDPCDPYPSTPGDHITLFEGFNNGIPTGWNANGNWTVTNGDLISVSTNGGGATMIVPVTTSQRQTISTQATILALDSGSTSGSIGIVDQFDGMRGWECGGARSGNGGALAIIEVFSGFAYVQTPHAFDVGTTFDLVFMHTTSLPTSYSCASGADRISFPTDSHGGAIALRDRIASGKHAWLMIVTSP